MSRRTESISSIAVVYSERDFSSFIQNCDFLTDNDAITVAVKSFNELLTFKVGLITFQKILQLRWLDFDELYESEEGF